MNVRLLKAEVVKAGMTFCELAERIGINKSGFYSRLRNHSFKQSEICAIKNVLGMSDELTVAIFFEEEVS